MQGLRRSGSSRKSAGASARLLLPSSSAPRAHQLVRASSGALRLYDVEVQVAVASLLSAGLLTAIVWANAQSLRTQVSGLRRC